MATMNSKNVGLSPAVADLGLGGQLQQQLEDDEEERKKKLMKSSRMTQMGGAAQALLGNQSIFG